MRHVNKKQSIRGAKKGAPKPQAAILNPPRLGGFKSVSSFSVAEIVDLISDGPIEGLVDQNGEVLIENIFKGVYLDNTPIQNTESLEKPIEFGGVSIAESLNAVARVWIEPNGNFKSINGQQAKLFSGAKTKSALRDPSRETGAAEFLTPIIFTSVFKIPSFFKLSNDTIEIHRISPLQNNSPILAAFETHIKTALNGGEISKVFADENIKKLERLKALMKESFYGLSNPVGAQAVSFIIINLGEVVIDSLKDRASDGKIDFFIDGLSDAAAYTFVQPEISNGKFTGRLHSMIVLYVPLIEVGVKLFTIEYNVKYFISKSFLISLNSSDIKLRVSEKFNVSSGLNSLFNFSNVSCEFKNGEEHQQPLGSFDKVFNDYFYESPLYGPFDKSANIQRIKLNPQFAGGIDNMFLSVPQSSLLQGFEGSVDIRTNSKGPLNYSNWNDENEKKDYESLSVTHTIENPFVNSVSVSVSVNSLSDTLEVTVDRVFMGGDSTNIGEIQAGSKVPSIVAIRIETGKITNGQKTEVEISSYSIVGLIEGMCVIDFGGGDVGIENLLKNSVRKIEGDNLINPSLSQPFTLPSLTADEEPSSTKRYVKIVKLSAETNSVLINKELSLAKITEIINEKFSYPFSAIAGIKLDARGFGSIPERSYDCKLKRVKIPSNYLIEDFSSGLDTRYVKSAKDYIIKKQIYIGDWDGTFGFGWTDNPAWILYDLLTSQRYGLGSYIDESQVNKWELYKIAKFCDAVDEEGFFVGVSNGFGGLEPRFSCNIVFKELTKVYDAINVIANLFRGIVFFGGSEIHFLDDRPRKPIALFSNSNVKEGLFNYSNVRRDLQFNTVEVVYLDRFDNYKTKVEYVQDEQDIRKRGVFKTTINTLGVTSRAMSRRVGQHIIHQTIKENQTIAFDAGLESLLCRPGDLIIVEDEMKTRSTNYGRILEVDVANKKLRIDNKFDDTQFTGFVTVYSPTGYATSAGLDEIAQIDRTRVSEFSMTNPLELSILSGLYKFSGYTAGYPFVEGEEPYPSQFPLYTGTGSAGQKLFCYYNTDATGFVFSTGLAFQDDNTFDKIITNTEVRFAADISAQDISDSSNYTGFTYNAGALNKRAAPSGQISGAINWNSTLYPPTRGILDSEIDTYNISQITKISLTGFDNTVDYGSFISLNQEDPNVVFLPAVKAGSVYRIERQLALDQIYKIISIRENSQNEYNVVASRYDTGKFETIEKSITQDFLENSSYTGEIRVGNVIVSQVATPQIVEFAGFDQTPQSFKLTGRWISGGGNITGFNVSVSNSLAGVSQSVVVNTTGVQFTELTNIGNWKLSVTSLASSSNINSSAAVTGTFVAYAGASDITTITKPAIISFSIE